MPLLQSFDFLLFAFYKYAPMGLREARRALSSMVAHLWPRPHSRLAGNGNGTDWPAGIDRVVEPEEVIKCITVIHLISTCIQMGYRNAPFGIEILVASC